MTQDFEFTFGPQKPKHDSRCVFLNGEMIGFQPKGKQNICVTYCPMCERENWAMSVSSGICCWCGWDANKKENNLEQAAQ